MPSSSLLFGAVRLFHQSVDAEWRSIMVYIVFDMPDHAVLNVHDPIGLVSHTAFVRHYNDRLPFFIELLEQLHNLD